MSPDQVPNMSAGQRGERGGAMMVRSSLRLSATLLLAGQLLYIVVTQFHADGDANNHPAVFAEYARSGTWTAVHLGQFAAASAVAALALYGVLQAVDGIANKQVDDAWVAAPHAEKAARFASAEA